MKTEDITVENAAGVRLVVPVHIHPHFYQMVYVFEKMERLCCDEDD